MLIGISKLKQQLAKREVICLFFQLQVYFSLQLEGVRGLTVQRSALYSARLKGLDYH